MRKLLLLTLLTAFLVDCSNHISVRGVKKSKRQSAAKLYRPKAKFSSLVKPSEVSIKVVTSVAKKPAKTLEEFEEKSFKTKSSDHAYGSEKRLGATTPSGPLLAAEKIERSDFDPSYDDEKYSGYFKIGNPYKVFGISYVPQNYEEYEESGTASWYGDDFHGKQTANGEIYNMKDMTAAHPTLPLPSLVRVTNLRNGKNTIVRVNDRGPFAKNRVIDVSEKVADILDFKKYGTTEVKIELMRAETDAMLKRLKLKN